MSLPDQNSPSLSGETLLTVEEAAQRLRLSVSALNKWRVSGDGPPFVKLGRRVLYRAADLGDWLSAARCSSTSERAARVGERA